MVGAEGVHVTVKRKGLWESRDFVELLCGLGCRSIEVAMGPSGTYGDPLRSGKHVGKLEITKGGSGRARK